MWKSSESRTEKSIQRLESRCLLSASEVVASNLSSVWSSVNEQAAIEPAEESADWIVRLTAEASSEVGSLNDISAILTNSDFDIQAIKGLSTPGLVEVRSMSDSVDDVERYLNSHVSVASFELDGAVTAQLSANDEFYASNSLIGLRNPGTDGAVSDADIDADLAWDITIGSTTVVTTVIDSGIDYRHPDLYLNIWLNNGEIPTSLRDQLVDVDSDGLITFRDLNQPENASFVTELTGAGVEDGNDYIDAGDLLADPIWVNSVDEDGNGRFDDIIGWDFRDNDNDPMDTHGHGTHVAGTIGAIGNNGLGVTGVTWVGQLMPLRFLDRVPGQGLTGSRSDAISAIEYSTDLAANRGVNIQVSNNSWGSLDSFSSELRTTIEANGDAGVLFVAAAGNGEGRTGRGIDLDTENIGFYPATYDLDTIVAVAASDPRDNLAIFSQFGATSIDLAAPGVGILSTDLNGTYSTRNGTSMATPHVAGTAALIFAHQADATPEEVRKALLEGVDTKSGLSSRVATGGRLNAQKALQADTFAPKAELVSADDVLEEAANNEVTVSYRDNADIDLNSIDETDIVVSPVGSDEIRLTATISGFSADADLALPGNQPQVTYRIAAPGGLWQKENNGVYRILLERDAIADTRSGTPNRTVAQELGTFEVDIEFVGEINVTTTADGADSDTGDGVSSTSGGESTLRSAIQTANATAGLNTIVLDAQTYEITIGGDGEDLATTGDLDITDDLLILGNGATILVNIPDGQNSDRVLDIFGSANVTLRDLTIEGGDVDGDGGGLRINDGTVEITGSLFTANTATTGGAIAQSGGTLNLTNSTISTNTAGNAAGIEVSGGTANILHATITNNTATASTGGLRQSSTGVVNLTNTIVAANFATTSDPDVTGTFPTPSHNLIGDAGTATGLTNVEAGNIVGNSGSPVDPLLGPLTRNIGLTDSHSLLLASPAIDHGTPAVALVHDQRGVLRPLNGDDDAFPEYDIGASERFFGTIAGTRFSDTDGDGVKDANEPGVGGIEIYLDLNTNGVHDPGEPKTITRADDLDTEQVDESGAYSFGDLPPRQYVVRELPSFQWSETFPASDPSEGRSSLTSLTTAGGGDGENGLVLNSNNVDLVYSAGDFNGDGLDDVILRDDNLLYVVFGTINAPAAEFDVTELSAANHPRGFVLFGPGSYDDVKHGDLNNDGFSDLLIGSSSEDPAGRINAGQVFVLFGQNDHRFDAPFDLRTLGSSDGTAGFVIDGTAAGDRLGTAVGIGDFDGNGVKTLVIGAAEADPNGNDLAGTTYLLEFDEEAAPPATVDLLGQPGVAVTTLHGEFPNDRFGAGIATGDVDGDNIDDLAVVSLGAFRSGKQIGAVYVIVGVTIPAGNVNVGDDTTGLVTYPVFGNSSFKIDSTIRIADFDSDGQSELVAGVSNRQVILQVSPEELIALGSATFNVDHSAFTDFDAASNLFFGDMVDIDGDGFVDMLYGSRVTDLLEVPQVGSNIVIFGAGGRFADFDLGEILSVQLDATEMAVFTGGLNEAAGRPTGLGDFNGDGFGDFVTFTSTNDRAYVVFGKSRLSAIPRDNSWLVRVESGRSVSSVDFGARPLPAAISGTVFRDINADGIRDVNEFGIANSLVILEDTTSGEEVERLITGLSGEYNFSEVIPNQNYGIRVVVPEGFTLTGTASYDLVPNAAEEFRNYDFALLDSAGGEGAGSSAVSGKIFSDLNSNGTQDVGEAGTIGATVFLDLNGNGVLDDSPVMEPRTTTVDDAPETAGVNEAGDYSFSTLGERNYDVRVVLPGGLTQTYPFANEFAEAASDAGEAPSDAVTVFFNDDDLPDLVFVTQGKNDVVVRLNNGDGTFAADVSLLDATTRGSLLTPNDIDTGDLNGDGKPDFVIGNNNGNRPTVLLSTPGGNFVLGSVPSLGSLDTSSVAIGHFDPVNLAADPPITDPNRFPDLAVASEFGDKVYILKNNGAGSFSLHQTISTATAPLDLVAGDLDNDGDDDLVVSQFGASSIRTWLLDQSGVFQTANPGNVFTKPTASNPFRLAAADFDRDGFLDVVATNVLDQRITLFRNQQTGVFEDGVNLLAGQNPASIITTDVNNDGAIDIVVTTLSNRGFATMLNLGDGTFQTPAASGVANLESLPAPALVASDIDLDGDPDIIVLQPERDGGTMFVETNSPIAGSYRISLLDGQTVNGLNFGVVDPAQLNQLPTLDTIDDVNVAEDAGAQTVNLSGISAGGSENQALRISAVSNNTGLIPNPVVSYSSADATGSLQFTAAVDAFGTATITVTVEDAGPDGDFDAADDNESFGRSFAVTVEASNDTPTVNAISNVIIQEDAGEQTVTLYGVTAGGGESQPLQISASSNNTSVVPAPTVTYLSPSSGGTLKFTSASNATGMATITVTVVDGGLDGDLTTTGDNASTNRQFTVNVTPVNDSPTINPIADPPAIDEDSAQQVINVTGITTGGENEALQVTVASSNNGLILPAITFDSGAGTAEVRYTPTANRSGSAVLTVTVRDPGPDGQFQPGVQDADDGVTTESFTVVVSAVNDPVTGIDESFTVIREEGAVTFDVLANENSANPDVGENLRVLFVTQPSLGSVEIINGGSEVRYTPPGGSVGQTSFNYVVTDGTFTDEATATVTVSSNQAPAGAVLVSQFTPGRSGFEVLFSEGLDRTTLNLYATQSLGPADFLIVGDSVGPVVGSVVVSEDLRRLSFVATGGLLPPDSYTVTLRSGADGITGSGGKLLDGNSDGAVGDNFVTTFTLTAPVAETVIASIPDFARGFGQNVDVPADGTGIPLTLSQGTGVTGLNLRLNYNRDLLNITGFVPTLSGVFSDFNAGSGLLALSSSSAFTGENGPVTVGYFTASVPDDAVYASKHVVSLDELVVFDDSVVPEEVPSLADSAIHVAAFPGDANASRSYNSPDTTLTLRQITETIDGLTAYPLLDPRLISDVTFNQSIQANDATVVQRMITQVEIPTIPDLPSGIDPLPPVGADPILSIPQDLTGRLGETVTVPVRLEVTETSGITVSGLEVALAFDSDQFSIGNVRAGSMLTGNARSPFSVSANPVRPGRLLITASASLGTELLSHGAIGEVLLIDFSVLPGAVDGASSINLLARAGGFSTAIFDDDLTELVLLPAPTNSANDAVDGAFTVSTEVTVVELSDSGQLSIRDASKTGRDNRITVTVDGEVLVIRDEASPVVTFAGTQVTENEVRVPLAELSSSTLLVRTAAGNDSFDSSTLSNAFSMIVSSGAGNDTVMTGSGDDLMHGGAGRDLLNGGPGNDNLIGGSGADNISGGSGDDLINGNAGRDSISGGAGNDRIRGGAGRDDIDGGADADSVRGGGGADTIRGGNGADSVFGGGGRDQIDGDDGADILFGGGGADNISGGLGADRLNGVDRDDTFTQTNGQDTLFGGQRPSARSPQPRPLENPSILQPTATSSSPIEGSAEPTSSDRIDDAFADPLLPELLSL